MILIPNDFLDNKQIEFLIDELTCRIPIYGKPGEWREVIFYRKLEEGYRVPRFFAKKYFLKYQDFFNKQKEDYQKINSECVFTQQMLNTPMKPQVEAVEKTLEQLFKILGAILVGPPGVGKTNMALYIACKLGLNCIILAHNDVLISQWTQRIKSCITGPVKIGLIQQDICEYENCDFIICSMKSIHCRQYPKEALKCGLVIVDEAHHVAATSYSDAVDKIDYFYSMGLTATPKRGDRLEYISEWLLGPQSFQIILPLDSKVQVNMITYSMGSQKEIKYKNGTLGLSTMVSSLTKDIIRNRLLLDVIKLLHKKFPTRKGLLLSARVDHLKQLYRDLDSSMCAIISGQIHTEMTNKERAASKRRREEVKFDKFLTLSTYDMFAEAVDFDGDFVIFATPKVHVEQPAGRIMRGKDLNYTPVIFDIVDPFSSFETWKWARYSFYKKRGYEIINLNERQIFAEAKKIQ